jgi:hypothetical protein
MGPGDWLDFEHFAAEFLAPDYPSLRTTATPSGDGGRDGEIYSVEEEPHTVIQYSVTRDWRAKINQTLARLAETRSSTRVLIYVTNQVIGALADDLVTKIRRERRIVVDIRDRHWFVERELTHAQRAVAATELATKYVDPLLADRGVRSFLPSVLDSAQARVALVHLALETEDKRSEKGWTKSCFEALVLSTLDGTSDAERLTRPEIADRIRALLPAGNDTQIAEQVAGALSRLSRRGGPIKHRNRQGEDSFALAHEEQQQLSTRLAAFALQEHALKDQLVTALRGASPHLDLTDDQWSVVASDLRLGLETVLLKRGEAFASAVTTGTMQQVSAAEILAAIIEAGRDSGKVLTDEQVSAAIVDVLDRPSVELHSHLRGLADAYTMYAFLRQTPDVQKAVLSIFQGGEIWLDTNMVLPLIAETLLEDHTERHYTIVLRAALDAGLKLFVSDGVVEELDRHLNMSLICARTDMANWRSRIPFIFASYTLSGRARAEFASWLENFRGNELPEEDLREYLTEVHGIDRRNLTSEAAEAPEDLRTATQAIWYAVHERRNNRPDVQVDPQTLHKLIAHDVENCLGVIQLRATSEITPVGYHQWFLTLDRTALTLKRLLAEDAGYEIKSSPALSPDFMAQYLRLAPVRTAVEMPLWTNLPLITDLSRYELIPKSLIDKADELRRNMIDMDERVIRRQIRETLNRMKQELGPEAFAGIRGMEEQIRASLRSPTRRS